MDYPAGCVIEYKDGDSYRLAQVVEGGGKALRALRQDGLTVKVSAKAVSFGPLASWPIEEASSPGRLEALERELEQMAEQGDLGETWELLSMEEVSASLEELAEYLLGGGGVMEQAATLRALRVHHYYFKQKKDTYEPRPQDQVEAMLHQKQAEEATALSQARFLSLTQGLLEQDPRSPLAQRRARLDEVMEDLEQRQRFLLLEDYAVQGDEFDRAKAAEALLDVLSEGGVALRGKQSERAWHLLVHLGRFAAHENLLLRRAGLSLDSDPAWQAQGQALVEAQSWIRAQAAPQDGREDLTSLEVWTIDAASTRDIDDGLSARKLPGGGFEFGIHIADPDHLLTKDSELDVEAQRRGTSVYLPEGVIPMLPQALSEDAASLLPGQLRPALSFFVQTNDDMEILDHRVALSWVRSEGRLSYDEVDAILMGELPHINAPVLGWMNQFAQQRLVDRLEQGAVIFQIPEMKVQVEWEDQEAGLVHAVHAGTLEDSPSRTLVQEMMVLAGELMGRFCEAHDVPVIYRLQSPPDDTEREDTLRGQVHSVVDSFKYRRWMRRGELSTSAAMHFGLGISTYVQCTSPIRRYVDLICHRQLKAHLRGEDFPYAEEELLSLAAQLDARGAEASILERESKRYWALVHLLGRRGQEMDAVVVDVLDAGRNRVAVMLHELALVQNLSLRHKKEPGDEARVKIDTVDPRRDTLVLRLVEG